MAENSMIFGLIASAVGLIVAGLLAMMIKKTPIGNRDMVRISGFIKNGAMAIAPTWFDWLGLALICIVLPAILCWAGGWLLRRIGWIKENDLLLN